MDSSRNEVIAAYTSAADELELAAKHLRTAARHMAEGEVPRACAHAFAAQGHIATSDVGIKRAAVVHASKAIP